MLSRVAPYYILFGNSAVDTIYDSLPTADLTTKPIKQVRNFPSDDLFSPILSPSAFGLHRLLIHTLFPVPFTGGSVPVDIPISLISI